MNDHPERTCKSCGSWEAPPSYSRDKRGVCHRIPPGQAAPGEPFIRTEVAFTRLVTPPEFSCPLFREANHA